MNSRLDQPDRRSKMIIKDSFQKKYLLLIAVSLIVSMALTIIVIYSLLYFQIQRAGFSLYTARLLSEVFRWLLLALPAVTIVLTLGALLWGRYLSFKVAGPLYALEKQIIMIIEGMIERVQLRDDDDELIPLANLLNELIEKKLDSKKEKEAE